MNLIDAIKSGRPWRPIGAEKWRDPIEMTQGYNELRIELCELFANYEIQEPTVTITRAQFWEAARSIEAPNITTGTVFEPSSGMWTTTETKIPSGLVDIDLLATKLGLGGDSSP